MYDLRADDMDLIVGTMHTHYPIRWAAIKLEKRSGPSLEDMSLDLPGILYDYEENLETNHSLELSRKFYKYGSTIRRVTPGLN